MHCTEWDQYPRPPPFWMSDEIGKHAKLKPLCLNDLGVRVSPRAPVLWSYGIRVITPPCQGGNTGATPVSSASFGGMVQRSRRLIVNQETGVQLSLSPPAFN